MGRDGKLRRQAARNQGGMGPREAKDYAANAKAAQKELETLYTSVRHKGVIVEARLDSKITAIGDTDGNPVAMGVKYADIMDAVNKARDDAYKLAVQHLQSRGVQVAR